MATAPHWAIPLLTEGQASGEVTHNDAIIRLAALSNLSVKDQNLTAPPGGETNGDRYLLPASCTGDWDDQDGKVALYYNGWLFFTVVDGLTAYVEDEDLWFLRKAGAWVQITTA